MKKEVMQYNPIAKEKIQRKINTLKSTLGGVELTTLTALSEEPSLVHNKCKEWRTTQV